MISKVHFVIHSTAYHHGSNDECNLIINILPYLLNNPLPGFKNIRNTIVLNGHLLVLNRVGSELSVQIILQQKKRHRGWQSWLDMAVKSSSLLMVRHKLHI